MNHFEGKLSPCSWPVIWSSYSQTIIINALALVHSDVILELNTFLTKSLNLSTSVTAIRKPNHQRQAIKDTERVCSSSGERRCCCNLERLVQVWLTRREQHSSPDLFHRCVCFPRWFSCSCRCGFTSSVLCNVVKTRSGPERE